MCGRFARHSTIEGFAARFGATGGFTLTPRYNLATSDALLLCRNAAWGGRELITLTWGLVPARSKEPKMGERIAIRGRVESLVILAGQGFGTPLREIARLPIPDILMQ
jgi:putative SOS response-associated peptidase YedK